MQAMIMVKTDSEGGVEAVQPSAVERVAPSSSGKTCVIYFSGPSNYMTVHESMEDIVERINAALLAQVLSSVRRYICG